MNAPLTLTPETILEAFRFRHACKVFDPARKIPEDQFQVLLEAARLSPSSFGMEPWQFLVIQNPALRQKLWGPAWGAQTKLDNASHFVILLARTGQDMRYDSPYIAHHLAAVDQLPPEVAEKRRAVLGNFQTQEFKLLESERAIWDWAAKQCYIPLANMMTVAALLGIDSCPIEGFDPEAVTAVLADQCAMDPAHFRPALMVAFGYRQNPQPEKRRQSLTELVRRFD